MTGSNGPNAPTTVSPALRTLGGAALLDATTGATLLGPGKPLALVAYLALNPGHLATREFLTDLLWADLDGDRPRHALRQVLWQVRHILGDSAFTGRDELRLAIPIPSDRDHFLAALDRGDSEAAVEAYGGPFLPDLAVPGGVEFEHWADVERNRLRAMFIRACEMATRRKLAASQFRDAQRIARRARDADPGNELGWRLLLESLAAGQDFITATLEADALEARTAAESRQLEPATRTILRLARQVSEAAPKREQELVAELIGREREYSLILEACERAARGPAAHVHVTAPAGLGKTRLLHDIRARLSAAGKRVVSIRTHPGERQIPYAMASELARAVAELPGVIGISPASAGALVALNPALSSRFRVAADTSAGEDALRNRAIAVTEALMAAAEEAPFALLIDDLHWSDPASRQLLDGILARLDGARIGVVTASRPVREAMPAIDTTITLTLPPLTESQVASFLTSLGSLPTGEPWARGIERGLHLATRGSPLLLLQLLKLALERGVLSLGEAGWLCTDADALGQMLREGEAMRNRLDALPRDQRWLVTTLAVAGIPLGAAALAHASSRPVDAVVPELEALEQIGVVLRSGPDWELSHDEIGAVASESLTTTAEQTAHRGIGGAMLADASTDPVLLIRAARHLTAAADFDRLALCARRYVRSAWSRGDGRSPGDLVSELLGPTVDPAVRVRVVAALPFRWRFGLWNRTWLVTAAIGIPAAVVITAASILTPKAPGPTMELVLFARTDSAMATQAVGIGLSGWNPAVPLEPGKSPHGEGVPQQATVFRFAPDGRRLLVTAPTGPETTDDLVLVERGKAVRLTAERRDDNNGTWSPDGRWIAFLSARWSPDGEDDYDLAILDPQTRAVRPLTRTRDFDLGMAWSPDGSRIAFARHYRERIPGKVCVVTFDGIDELCRELPGLDVSGVVGWLDPGRLALEADRLADRSIVAYDLETGRVTTLVESGVSGSVLSPDGNWLACICARGLDDPPGMWVLPSQSPTPSQMRRVDVTNVVTAAWRPLVPLPSIDSLHVRDVTVPLDGSAAPEVVPLDGRGGRMALPRSAYRWEVTDTTIAGIDVRSGHLTPRRVGTTRLSVTAGGWRSASAALTVTPAMTTTLLVDSTWDDLDTSLASGDRWRMYGTPLPRRVDSAGGPALSNNGDGIYSSGVYSREAFPAGSGLGVEAVLSVPLTRTQWQGQSVLLHSERHTRLDGWDHRSGGPPSTAFTDEACSAGYPAREGNIGPLLVGAAAAGTSRRIPVQAPYDDGRWFRLRVQIFSDGTCGVAVDGEPVWRSTARLPLDQRYRLQLGGNSARTTVRIGKVEMWVGVRQDVEWGKLGR